MHITKGYSREHRAALNPMVCQLLGDRQAGIGLLMPTLDDNNTDKESFRDLVANFSQTVDKPCSQPSTTESKAFARLCQQNFAGEADARQALAHCHLVKNSPPLKRRFKLVDLLRNPPGFLFFIRQCIQANRSLPLS